MTISAKLPELLKIANRGVQYLNHVEFQQAINCKLPKAEVALKNRELNLAVALLKECVNLCHQIKIPDDVADLNFIDFITLEHALEQTQELYNAFTGRSNTQPGIFAQQAIDKIELAILSKDDEKFILQQLTLALKSRWQVLDSKDLQPLVTLLTEAVEKELSQYKCLIACCYDGSHYIGNQKMLLDNMNNVIDANLPQDILPTIKIDLFAPQVSAETQPTGMFFLHGSESLPVATVVNNTTTEQSFKQDLYQETEPELRSVMT